MSQTQSSLELEWLELLRNVQNTLANTVNSLDIKSIPAWEVRFLLWAAVSVNQATRAYILLREADMLDASKHLIRPIVEAVLAAQAVLNKRGFLFRKLYTEHRELIKFSKNIAAAEENKALDDLKSKFLSYNMGYPIECKRVNIEYTAQVANMVPIYEVVYRTYCQFTHGAQVAVTGQLNAATNDLDTPIVVQLGLITLEQLRKNTSAKIPEWETYLQQSRSYMGQSNMGINLPKNES